MDTQARCTIVREVGDLVSLTGNSLDYWQLQSSSSAAIRILLRIPECAGMHAYISSFIRVSVTCVEQFEGDSTSVRVGHFHKTLSIDQVC